MASTSESDEEHESVKSWVKVGKELNDHDDDAAQVPLLLRAESNTSETEVVDKLANSNLGNESSESNQQDDEHAKGDQSQQSPQSAKPLVTYETTVSYVEWLFLTKCQQNELTKLEAQLGEKVVFKQPAQADDSLSFDLEPVQVPTTVASSALSQGETVARWQTLLSAAQKKLRSVRLTVSETGLSDVETLHETVKSAISKLGTQLFVTSVNSNSGSVNVVGLGVLPDVLRSIVLESGSAAEEPTPSESETVHDQVERAVVEDPEDGAQRGRDSGAQATASSKVDASGRTNVPVTKAAGAGTRTPPEAASAAQSSTVPKQRSAADRLDQVAKGASTSKAAVASPTPTPAPAPTPLQCPICKDELEETSTGWSRAPSTVRSAPCGHTFHAECLRNSLDYAPICPVCRTPCSADAETDEPTQPSFLLTNPRVQQHTPYIGAGTGLSARQAPQPPQPTSFFSFSSPFASRTIPLQDYLDMGTRLDIVAEPRLIDELRKGRNMPAGQMDVRVEDELYVPGYSQKGCIVVLYTLSNAALGNEEPGTPIIAYLPNVPDAHRVAAMLRVAFDQRWTFFLTGERTRSGVPIVTWGPLTHKTDLFGDPEAPTFYSYPDDGYLKLITTELRLLGITPESAK